MTLEAWAALAAAFVLGAMSPGPSLAVVLRNTVAGGRRGGVLTGLGHGIGFGVYAFAAAAGLAAALAAHEATGWLLRWGGAALLVYLGVVFLRSALRGPRPAPDPHDPPPGVRGAFAQGFAVAIFNPKILAWMLAIYAPFVDAGASLATLAGMAVLGMSIDATWYMGAATVASAGNGIARLRAVAHHIDGAMGLLMLAFAVLLATGAL